MRRVIGIDPGLEDTGWAVIETDDANRIILKGFGLIKTSSKDALSKRLKKIYDGVVGKIKEFDVDAASIEEVYFMDKIKTQSLTTHSRGVILLAFENSGVKYSEYNPRVVKNMITGNGNAKKSQIQSAVRMMFSIKEDLYPDVADAIAIALTELRLFKLKEKKIL